MSTKAQSGISLNLLMSDAVVLLQTIKARIATMDAIPTDNLSDDALADMYGDRDGLERLHGYIQHEFQAAFGMPPLDDEASYEPALR